MNRLISIITITIICNSLNTLFGQFQPIDPFEQNKKMGRGVNIIGYDPLWRSMEQARFKEKHFKLLKEAGFQSVRINLHPFRYMDATNNYALRRSWLNTLDWAVSNALANGLQTILDLHEYNTMAQDPEGNKERFIAFWKQISEKYKNAPNSVVYEILNEPNKRLTPELWNKYFRVALAIIRETNPERNVIIGPAFWNSVDHLKELDLPKDDRHIIITVHYYKPMQFTHQGAAWAGYRDKVGVNWGSEAEMKAVRDEFARVAEWAKANNRPIFLGEFGAYDKAPMESRVKYTDYVARTAESFGWSWAYWQFDSDFILWDMKADKWVEPILKALVPDK
ncbi:MAG: glycoside hydrolase family 5 protein [Verrucomicrobiia bacterium]